VEDIDLYVDEEEEAVEEEGANRTFIILVGALGGLLALGICAFIAWAFWLSPQRSAVTDAILATNTAIVAQATDETIQQQAVTVTVRSQEATEETEEAEATSIPTDTPQPTATKPPTRTPAPETATPAEVAEGPTDTPKPTVTRRPTATSKASGEDVPDTGLGALGAGAVGAGLLFLVVLVRRLRRAL
jgi:cytoskeletal protein RodZ